MSISNYVLGYPLIKHFENIFNKLYCQFRFVAIPVTHEIDIKFIYAGYNHKIARKKNIIKQSIIKPIPQFPRTSWSVLLNVSDHTVYHYVWLMDGDLTDLPDINP